MLRVGFLTSAVAVGAACALPSSALAASTYTVDAGAGAGCSADKVCRTITDAVAAVADGDTITVKPGSYTEPAKLTLTKKNVTLQGTFGSTTVTLPAAATAGDAAITLAEGDVVDGLTIVTGTNAGPAILAGARNATVRNTAITRLASSSADAPAIKVATGVASGTTTISKVTILNGPLTASGQTAPGILGNDTSTLAITDSVIFTGAGQGGGIGLTGNDVAAGEAVPNTVTRTSIVATNPSAPAISFAGGATSSIKKALKIDTSLLIPGPSAAGIAVSTATTGSTPAADTSGPIAVTATHITTTGGSKPFDVQANARGAATDGAGSITLTLDRSIVHGKGAGTVASYVPPVSLPSTLPVPLPIPSVTGNANTAAVTIKQSDTSTAAFSGSGGKATIVRQGTITDTPDAQLFANPARVNYSLRSDAPVIDKGGPYVAGESETDINGDDRKGVTTDLGADEYVNHAPVAAATAPPTGRQNVAVTFDGSGSRDPDAGDTITTYKWSFGDGQSTDTTTPTVAHAYAAQGIYRPTLTVLDNHGATSAVVQFGPTVVGDGTPPTVSISSPSKNGSFAITVSAKVGSKIKRVFDKALLKKVVFSGKASDEAGIQFVLLSLKRLAVGNAAVPSNPKACVFLGKDKTTFSTASCKKPVFFTVTHDNGQFSYHLNSKVRPKAGKYQLAVVAMDKNGNFTNAFTVDFTLK